MHLCTCPPSQVTTLQSVLENMTVEEMADTLIIIFIAETDPDSVFQISSDVQKQFHQVGALNPLTILTPPTPLILNFSQLKIFDFLMRLSYIITIESPTRPSEYKYC